MVETGKSDISIGLDIGTYSIKVASMEKMGEKNTLTAYNIKRIIFDEKGARRERTIKEAFDEVDLHPEEVNLSISGPEVIVRFINLPKMNKEQLTDALAFEAEKYIPFNASEVVLDSLILGDALESGQMRVLLAAAKRDPVETRVRLIKKLGIGANIMDINPFAAFNAYTEVNPSLEEKEGNAFLDLGHSQTDILIAIGILPCFMRQIQIGGKDITAALCRDLSISPEKAEEYKLGVEKGNKEVFTKATGEFLDALIKEMQLSFGYFENRFNKAVSNIYCSGGMIYQEGVIDYLSEHIGIVVKKWNPVEGIELSENLSKQDIDSVASQLAVCVGLALRG